MDHGIFQGFPLLRRNIVIVTRVWTGQSVGSSGLEVVRMLYLVRKDSLFEKFALKYEEKQVYVLGVAYVVLLMV